MAGPPEIYRAASALGAGQPFPFPPKNNTRLTLGCCAALVCQKYLPRCIATVGREGSTDGHDAVLLMALFIILLSTANNETVTVSLVYLSFFWEMYHATGTRGVAGYQYSWELLEHCCKINKINLMRKRKRYLSGQRQCMHPDVPDGP